MTAVGMFAGRGDVVLAMLVCGVGGFAIGWWARGKLQAFREWRQRRRERK